MGLLILSGVLAFLAWCVTPTSLKAEDVYNSKGEITVWSVLSAVLVQMVLWTLVFIFVFPIIPHLPRLLTTGWRLPLTFFVAAFWSWFALFMVLQYLWTILRATLKTAVMSVIAKLGSQSAKQSLDEAPSQLAEMERNASIGRKEIEERGKQPWGAHEEPD